MRPRVAAGLAVLGAVGLVVVGSVAPQPGLSGLGWAVLAGTGASLMLRGGGLRVMAVLGAALSLAAGGIAVSAGGVALAALLPVAAVLAAALQAWRAGTAGSGTGSGRRRHPLTAWQRMDAGEDPTRDDE